MGLSREKHGAIVPFEQSKYRLNFFLMYFTTKSICHSRYTLIYQLSLRVAARIN